MLVYKNIAITTLASAIGAGDTTITVTTGSNLPQVTARVVLAAGAATTQTVGSGLDDYFYICVDDQINKEYMKVTDRSTNTLTVVRAQDGTSAQSFAANSLVELHPTKLVLEKLQEEAFIIQRALKGE